MAEIQESGNKKGGKSKQKKNDCQGGLYTYGGHEHVADYLLYALYLTEQTSDHGDKHAEQ